MERKRELKAYEGMVERKVTAERKKATEQTKVWWKGRRQQERRQR